MSKRSFGSRTSNYRSRNVSDDEDDRRSSSRDYVRNRSGRLEDSNRREKPRRDPFSSEVLVPRARPQKKPSLFQKLKEESDSRTKKDERKSSVLGSLQTMDRDSDANISAEFSKVDDEESGYSYRGDDLDLEAEAFDRDWYDNEEGAVFDVLREDKPRRISAKAAQRIQEQNKWEENRLLTSGAMYSAESAVETIEEDSEKVHIIVHSIEPEFEEGDASEKTVVFGQQKLISVVKDETSDMAVLARKGSRLLREIRETADRNALKEKFWEVAGSKMGKAIGVKQEITKEELEDLETLQKGDDKSRLQFKDLLKNSTDPASAFSASKSYSQQRKYLPIFSVKDELLRVIRDNRVVVVVGHTGSGKTTQMTQYLLEEGYGQNGIIGCTQPRRVAAVITKYYLFENVAFLILIFDVFLDVSCKACE